MNKWCKRILAIIVAIPVLIVLGSCSQRSPLDGSSESQVSAPTLTQRNPQSIGNDIGDSSQIANHLAKSVFENLILRYEKVSEGGLRWYDAKPSGIMLEYEDKRVLAPVRQDEVQNSNGCAIYLNAELSVIVDGGMAVGEKVVSYVSVDSGESWTQSEVSVPTNMAYRNKSIGFWDSSNGFLFLISEDGETCVVFLTPDGGTTWNMQGSCSIPKEYGIYGGVLTRTGKGYICGWSGKEAVCFRSEDSGMTWKKVELEIPDDVEYDSIAANVPYFEENNGIMPLALRFDDGRSFEMAYLASADDGETWTYYR